MTNKYKNVLVFINSENFPFGYASVEKIKLLGHGLIENNYSIYVLNKFCNNKNIKKHAGSFKKIIFFYSSLTVNKLSKYEKLILLPYIFYIEYFFFKKVFNLASKRIIILQYTNIILVIWYRLIAKVFKAKLVINTMEYHYAIKKGINSYLFDYYASYFADGLITISDYLGEIAKKFHKNINLIKIPVTVDHSYFDMKKSSNEVQNYSLFCASAGHIRVIKYVLAAFRQVRHEGHELVLIVSGSNVQIDQVFSTVKNEKRRDLIKIYSNIEYELLIKMYKLAFLLLIPLFNDERDKARFPHKIGEYTASKRPFFTNNVGEIKNYFFDKRNAFVNNTFDSYSYGERINEIIEQPQLAAMVGNEGYETSIKYFNHIRQAKEIIKFTNNI